MQKRNVQRRRASGAVRQIDFVEHGGAGAEFGFAEPVEWRCDGVQVRVNVWDFFLVFGTLQQQSETQVEVRNFQGIYLSPQQAKALMSILQQNVSGYESTFGEIKLDPRMAAAGPVH